MSRIPFRTLFLAAATLMAVTAYSQTPTEERQDSLKATVKVGRRAGNYLSKGKDIRTEVISASGLCKMACCNLAESFENSASVTVGYADAVTGARQIRLLGQNGIYTQMLDENRPVMRGLASPFGLTYVPGQWLESIQIGKGVPSVINGVESMTGQINMEHRKPTDEKPFYVQASVMSDLKADVNVASSLQLDPMGRWSTVVLAHADANFMDIDMNRDGFLDDPRTRQFSLANRWLYQAPSGAQVRFGVSGIMDNRKGGRLSAFLPEDQWNAIILNNSFDAYLKVGIPLNEENTRNVAAVLDYNWQDMNSNFGFSPYKAQQNSAFVNLLYQDQSNDGLHYTLGLSNMMDYYDEGFKRLLTEKDNDIYVNDHSCGGRTLLNDVGAFAEATFLVDDIFTAVVGLRGDYYNGPGLRFSPRVTLRWNPHESIVLRANGGKGIRSSLPLIDNIGVLSTGKPFDGYCTSDGKLRHPLEESWTFGGNATWYIPIDPSGKTYFSVDYFRTQFSEQMLVENTAEKIYFYTLSDLGGGAYSHTDNYQVDFYTEPAEGLSITLTGRYTDARQTMKFQESDIKPMTCQFKGVANIQYATHLNKWIFDFTASVNGPCQVWDFMKTLNPIYEEGRTPIYPLIYAQVTKRFKGVDIYAGVENLTGYVQPDPIIRWDDPFCTGFDASCIWGPLMGTRFYGGIRVTIWKTE